MPERNYRRLRGEDRHIIYRMGKGANSQSEIALALGCSQSTISKELCRNRGRRGYRPMQAQENALERQREKRHRSRVIAGKTEEAVRERLERKHSPEQISGELRRERVYSPSRTSIYNYVQADKESGGGLYKNLRINGKRRYRHRNKASRSKLPNRVGIEERPAIVERRCRYGDWEADLIEGRKSHGCLLSLYERKSHFGKLVNLPNKESDLTAKAIIVTLRGCRVHTITYDNGYEFAGHEQVSAALGGRSYFCQPYHSWEKGGIENYNGLVRQYYPKGTNFLNVSEASLAHIETEINERPRKTLNFRSPSNLQSRILA